MVIVYSVIIVLVLAMIFAFLNSNDFKEWVYNLLWKALEIVGAGALGYAIFVLTESTFNTLVAIISLALTYYFFSAMIKKYIDIARKIVYKKITGIDKEEF